MTRSRLLRSLVGVLLCGSATSDLLSQSLDPRYPSREYIRLGGRVVAIEQPTTPVVDKTSLVFSSAAGSQTIKINSSQPLSWTAVKVPNDSTTAWLSIPVSSGSTAASPISPDGTPESLVTISAQENGTGSSRQATVKIAVAPYPELLITITQQSGGNFFSVSPDSVTVSASPTTPFQVQVSSNMPWTVSANTGWIKNLPTGSLTGNQTVSFTVDPNLDITPRPGTITFVYGSNSKTVNVNQNGNGQSTTPCPSSNVTLDLPAIQAAPYAGGYDLRVTANVPWQASTESGWIHPINASGDGGIPSGEVMKFTVDANTTLAARTGKITFRPTCNTGQTVAELSVTQTTLSPTLSPASATIIPGATLYLTVYTRGGVQVPYEELNWSISPAGLGTIFSEGRYESSPSAHSTDVVTITASLKANPSVSSSTQVQFESIPSPARVSITPTSSSGTGSRFVTTATPGLGSIQEVQVLFGTTGSSAAGACLLALYPRSDNTGTYGYPVLMDDAGQTLIQPTTFDLGEPRLGATGYLENSQCNLNLGSSSQAITGTNTVTDALELLFNPTFSGNKNIYMYARSQYGDTGSYVPVGTFSVTSSSANTAPRGVSVLPSVAAGGPQTFTASYTDDDGVIDLESVFLLINGTPTTQNGCLLRYDRRANRLYLAGDDGVSWSLPMVPGDSLTFAQNNQCGIQSMRNAAIAVDYTNKRLTLSVPLSFVNSFTGAKNIYLYAKDYRSSVTTPTKFGDYIVEYGSITPYAYSASVVSVSIPGNVNTGQPFTASVVMRNTGTKTWTADTLVRLGSQNPQDNMLWGISRIELPSPILPGQSATFSFTATAPATAGAYTFAWKMLQENVTWFGDIAEQVIFVGGASIPATISVSPAAGAGLTQTFVAKYAHSAGATSIQRASLMIAQSPNAVSACYIYLDPATNSLRLMNDDGVGTSAASVVGSGADLANSQCTIHPSMATAVLTGNEIRLTVPIDFQPAFAGNRKIYLQASDANGATTGWNEHGSWKVNATPTVAGIAPSSGSGGSQTFTVTYSDLNGYSDIANAFLLINTAINGVGACYVRYDQTAGGLYLADDNNVGWGPALPVGSTATIENSQCRINSVAASGSSNTLTLIVSVAFKSPFAARRNLYQRVDDLSGAGTGWSLTGSWVALGSGSSPSVIIDTPTSNTTVSGTTTIGGWALDSTTRPESAISRVEIYIDGVKLGNANYGSQRLDVCATYPDRPGCPNVGYTMAWNTSTFSNGSHTVRAVAYDSESPAKSTAVEVVVTVANPQPPTITLDSPASGSTVSGVVRLTGWALDNATQVETAIQSVNVYVDNALSTGAAYGQSRPDVCAANAYPGRPGCPNVGFISDWDSRSVANGTHTVRLDAKDSDASPKIASVQRQFVVSNPVLSASSAGPKNLTISATTGTLAVYAFGVQNATAVSFATWSVVNGQDDLIWYPGVNIGGGTWRASIDLSKHPGTGQIAVNVYLTNGSTTVGFDDISFTRNAPGDWPAAVLGQTPTGTGAVIKNVVVSATTGTLEFYAVGVRNATSVSFPTWSVVNGQDDLIWYTGENLGNGTWKGTIDLTRHRVGSPDTGQIAVNVWMGNGSNILVGLDDVTFTRQ